MKTVIIYGIEHKGNTYHVVQSFKEKLKIQADDVTEFFLPKDMPHFCAGCSNCFMKGEELCPHYGDMNPIIEAILNADLIIFACPTFIAHIPAQMKALIDHLAYLYLPHRPREAMFHKTALVVSTVGGAGMRAAIKYLKSCLNMLGISQIFTFGAVVGGMELEDITRKVQKKVKRVSDQILAKQGRVRVSLKTKGYFLMFRLPHKGGKFIPYEREYWKKQGWLGNSRPW